MSLRFFSRQRQSTTTGSPLDASPVLGPTPGDPLGNGQAANGPENRVGLDVYRDAQNIDYQRVAISGEAASGVSFFGFLWGLQGLVSMILIFFATAWI